jgi:hypothetical protein
MERRFVTITINDDAHRVVARSAQVGYVRDTDTGEPLASLRFTQHFGWKVEPLPRKGEPSRRYYANAYDACKARGWTPTLTINKPAGQPTRSRQNGVPCA